MSYLKFHLNLPVANELIAAQWWEHLSILFKIRLIFEVCKPQSESFKLTVFDDHN